MYISKYNKGKIYKIIFDVDKIYIGQTCKELSERLQEHINDKKNPIFGYKDAKLSLNVITRVRQRKSWKNVRRGT